MIGPGTPRRSPGDRDIRRVDTLVLGLGAMGSAALYHLSRAGVSAVGVEQYEIDHPNGASFGESRAFRPFYDDPLYVELARAALPLWRDLERRSGESLLEMCGNLYFGDAAQAEFASAVRVAAAVGLEHELMTPGEATRRFPILSLPSASTVCLVPESGFLRPSLAVRTHIRLARASGATVLTGASVESVELTGGDPIVRTRIATFRCRRLILTPGPWAAEVLADLALPLHVTRQEKFYFSPADPAGYGPASMPVFSDYDTEFYGFPLNGPGIKVANDRPGDATTPDAIDRHLDVHERDRLGAWLRQLMPRAQLRYVTGMTCMYNLTPDRDFLVGPHPESEAVVIGTGFSGHGFKFSTLIGRILADLATIGSTSYPIERFRLDRFSAVPGRDVAERRPA